jgi:hypothetical protein
MSRPWHRQPAFGTGVYVTVARALGAVPRFFRADTPRRLRGPRPAHRHSLPYAFTPTLDH